MSDDLSNRDRSKCGDGHATTQSTSNMVELLNSGQLNQAKFNSIQFYQHIHIYSHTAFAFEFLILPKKNTFLQNYT